MKMFKNYLSAMFLAGVAMFTIGCDDNDEIAVDPDAEYDVVLEVSEATPTPNVNFAVTSTTPETIEAKIAFTSTTKSMKRLYITVNDQGAGEELYEPSENIDLKADGSVDLTGKNDKDFEFAFTLPVPAADAGTVVYKFWTTDGNGDFRDVTQRLAVGAGTITLTYGGANPAAEVKSYTNVKLFAPLADGTSKTFVSLLDGDTYNVSAGIEFVSRWDFGYLYSVTADAATLRAPFSYPAVAIDIPAKAGVTNDELNKTYFKKSTKTTAEFDAIATAADLAFVSVAATVENIVVKQLAVNDVVEFVDNYGKKGLLKVTEINPGNGAAGFITFSIKVQP